MKKILLLTVMLIGMIMPSVAKDNEDDILWYKTTHINIDNGYGWTGWRETECNVRFDFSRKNIVIFSKEQQILDFTTSEAKDYDWGTKISMLCTDTKYVTCYLELFCYNSGSNYIKITYNNIIYKYNIVPLD